MTAHERERDDPTAERAETAGTEPDLTRREMIKLSGGAAIAVAAAGIGSAEGGEANQAAQSRRRTGAAAKAKAPRFFTREEFALVDELTELIIPGDDHSPGARAAHVAAYIDFRLSESLDEQPGTLWRTGLKLIDSLSHEMHGKPFLESSVEQRVALLSRISLNEEKPAKPEERFFRELKSRTVRAYYTSKIGIHTELEYKGNTYQKVYAGFDAT